VLWKGENFEPPISFLLFHPRPSRSRHPISISPKSLLGDFPEPVLCGSGVKGCFSQLHTFFANINTSLISTLFRFCLIVSLTLRSRIDLSERFRLGYSGVVLQLYAVPLSASKLKGLSRACRPNGKSFGSTNIDAKAITAGLEHHDHEKPKALARPSINSGHDLAIFAVVAEILSMALPPPASRTS